jgi:hypothetical protein
MKNYLKKIFLRVFILMITLLSVSGCSIFKSKKHKCADCPKWNNIELQKKEVSI